MWAKMQASMLSTFAPATTPPEPERRPNKPDSGKRRG
jgi:hypothetical protein